MGTAITCCPPPAQPVPARQRRADRRPGRHRHDRADRERRADIEQIRALLPRRARPRHARPAGLPGPRWRQLSHPARGRFLRALDPGLSPADRIRYRTGTPQAAIPDDPPGLLAARARAVPQLLWPEWAIRLMPARGFAPGPFRSAVAACLLLPGHPGRATSTAITALHAYRSVLAVGAVLRALAGGGHDTVLTAISCLAGYLDTYGSPIDYQRRRDLIPAGTITAGQWSQLCYGAAAHPGEARGHRDAQRYLFQLLTGADLHDPRHALAFTSNYDYSRYHAFAGTLPTRLRDALHHHAAALLHDLGIGEPLTWAPPPGCCAGLNLPGPEPDDIDLDAAGDLIIAGQLPAAEAAAQLGTSTGHVRLAIDRVPRPDRQWGRSAAPPTWQRRQHDRAVLTRCRCTSSRAGLGTSERAEVLWVTSRVAICCRRLGSRGCSGVLPARGWWRGRWRCRARWCRRRGRAGRARGAFARLGR